MRLLEAIFLLNSDVAVIRGDTAFDSQGRQIEYDKVAAQALVETNSYKTQRSSEYPPITDYLDGVVKGDQAQIDKYIADCQAVKAKYPKGS